VLAPPAPAQQETEDGGVVLTNEDEIKAINNLILAIESIDSLPH
jgi:hypothetical protein